eukprot:TRINITY_DN11626_c0_g1_i1.p1 TRINITY_DN11626_c0_g1~~TRINITY_DN11626_c0_g1_i1.p1  ORF type:complete len:264 (-),score=70.35 TRINITY_DN11626_c0_g1_i1:32-823(-)
MSIAPKRISTKRKFINDGLFYSELNSFLEVELAEDGYAGIQVRVTPQRTEIVIKATRTKDVIGDKGKRIRELTEVVRKRFGFKEDEIELFADRLNFRGLSAAAQCESLRHKLVRGLPVRRACYGVMRFVMEAEAKGCEVVVSGKLRSQRAKAMKFNDGYMKKSGQASKQYVETAIRHVKLKSGVMGIKVSIMLPWDPTGKKKGPQQPLPDIVRVLEPKVEEVLQATPTHLSDTGDIAHHDYTTQAEYPGQVDMPETGFTEDQY